MNLDENVKIEIEVPAALVGPMKRLCDGFRRTYKPGASGISLVYAVANVEGPTMGHVGESIPGRPLQNDRTIFLMASVVEMAIESGIEVIEAVYECGETEARDTLMEMVADTEKDKDTSNEEGTIRVHRIAKPDADAEFDGSVDP